MSSFFMSTLRNVADFWYGGLKERICFLHIPKCGGLSVEYAIKRHSHFSNVFIDAMSSFHAATLIYQLNDPVVKEYEKVLKFREYLLIYYMGKENVRFVNGHFCFSDLAYCHFHDKYKYITILRDPVKRWISSYFFHRYKTKHTDYVQIEDDLITFLKSERGRYEGQRYVQMIGGLDDSGDYKSQRAIDRAKANLHKFEIVGCLEYFDDFHKQFQDRFGIKLKKLKKNKNPKSQAHIKSIVTKEIEEEITRFCQSDIEVYNYAVETFVNKK